MNKIQQKKNIFLKYSEKNKKSTAKRNNTVLNANTEKVSLEDKNIRSHIKSYNIDKKKNKLHSKNVTYFFFNKDIQIMSKNSFKKHGHYQKWTYFFKRLFGMNKNILKYILPYWGIHKHSLYTTTDEYFFIYFKYILRNYSDFFSLSWFLLYIKQRTYLLTLLIKGIRFIKHLPSRGQRTRSNYKTVRMHNTDYNYSVYKKTINKHTVTIKYPSWKQTASFYFHRY